LLGLLLAPLQWSTVLEPEPEPDEAQPNMALIWIWTSGPLTLNKLARWSAQIAEVARFFMLIFILL
jgi:hypothetical protein